MDLCVNCGIATNRCTTIGRRALDDERTLYVIRQWRSPQPVNSTDHVCQACWDLAQKPPVNGEPRRIGHRSVCLRCGRSLTSRVSHPLHTSSTREAKIYNVIQEWIVPRSVEEASCICHKCWVAADRAAARMFPGPSTSSRGLIKKDIKPQVQEIPTQLQDENVETKQPTIISLPDYSYTYTIEAESKPQLQELPTELQEVPTELQELPTELQDEDVDVETMQLDPTIILLPDHITAIKTESNPLVQELPTELQDEDVDVETMQLDPTIILLPDYMEDIETESKPLVQELPTELQELPTELQEVPTELQDEEIEVETKQIEPTIILPDYKRAIETESRCFIRGCRSKKRRRVPLSTRKMLLIQHKYYVPVNNRLCDQHIATESWDFLNSLRNCLQTFTATQIQDMLSLKEFDEKNDHVHTCSGFNKAQFNTKLTNSYLMRQKFRPRRRYKKFMYRKLRCEPCGIKFDSRQQSDHHKQEMHKNSQGWVCEVCGKMFVSLAGRGRHAQTHLPPRFACDHCHYKTATKKLLVDHMRVHTGARPQQCEHCPKTFPTSSNAKRHIQRVHLRLKPHSCPHPHCGRTFFCKYKRNTHADTHKSIKRFECEECGSCFMLRSSWRKHLLDRHGVDTEWLRPGPDHDAVTPLA